MTKEAIDNNLSAKKTGRNLSFDYLRVLATYVIMLLHTAAQHFHEFEIDSLEWKTINFYESISRWGVPIFVMISGALFLGRDIPIKKIYSKYILRLAAAYFFWSTVYVAVLGKPTLRNVLIKILKGHSHMWFIWMIIGIYMCLPFIRPIVADTNRMLYFLLLSFIFAIFLPSLTQISNDFAPKFIQELVDASMTHLPKMRMFMVMGFTGYFISGHYINTHPIKKTHRIYIYILGFIGLALTIILNYIVSLNAQKACDYYYRSFSVNILLLSIAIFTFFKYHEFAPGRISSFVVLLSKYSFGAYLVHKLVLLLLLKIGIDMFAFGNPIFSLALFSILVFVLSFAISMICGHIPVLNKYII